MAPPYPPGPGMPVLREAIADQRETEQNPGRSEVAVETIPSPGLDGDPSLGGLPERFLRGTVLDEKYAPIAEAWVLTDQEHDAVQTDEAGVFEVALLHDFGPSEGRRSLGPPERRLSEADS